MKQDFTWNKLSQLQRYALEEYGHDEESWNALNHDRQNEFLIDATTKQDEDLYWMMKEFI